MCSGSRLEHGRASISVPEGIWALGTHSEGKTARPRRFDKAYIGFPGCCRCTGMSNGQKRELMDLPYRTTHAFPNASTRTADHPDDCTALKV